MSQIILLDSTPVGLITNPKTNPLAVECQEWFNRLFQRGFDVILPEIVDYEIRRELLRANKINGLRKLDQLKAAIIYLPLTTEIMLKAAELWSEARKRGKPTADNKGLDGDVILAAQAIILENIKNNVIVATSNPKHLSELCNAKKWQEI
ncbi:PIN domain-containing protein [Spirulina sp. CS-785/01]|uniref:type II toxin-antitoxin system VapC family toxin n=1 Tax=Spirulina sp. CS-785/01 TaxID=3021716 RepID=UPI00232F1B73|nr:PIN domain-containing protein [Spirulina sp. CS-785/01]MDB9315493.1 PIN domain-containing protein [Spirulina sp. CS-785/01]